MAVTASKPVADHSKGIWSPVLFFALAAVLLALVAVKALYSSSTRPRLTFAGGFARRGDPEARVVMAELVADKPVALPPARGATASPVIPTAVAPPAAPPVVAPPAAREVEVTAEPRREPSAPTEPIAATSGPVPEEPEEARLAGPVEEICQIALWRGYAKSRFYARLEAHQSDEEFALAESRPFRYRGNGSPDRTEASTAAHGALIAELMNKGWVIEGSADPWYAVRLHRDAD